MEGRGPDSAISPLRITAGASAVMALNGLVGASWGAVLVPAAAHFRLGLVLTGSIFAVRGASSMAGALAAGTLSERLPRHWLLAAYGVVLVAGLLVVALAPSWWVVLGGTAAISAAFAGTGTEAASLVSIAVGARRGRYLNITNAIYGLGAAAGPLLVGVLVSSGSSWRWAFVLWAALAAAVVPAFGQLAGRLPGAASTRRRPASLRGAWGRQALVLWAIAFTYNGVAWTIVGWSATWFVQRFGTGLLLGASSATVFYLFLTVGRLGNAAAESRFAPRSLLAVEAVATGAGLIAAALAHSPLPAMVAFAFTGLAMGGLYPNAQAEAIALVPERPGALAASVGVAGAVGTMTVPALTGLLPDSAAAMGSLPLWAVVMPVLGVLGWILGRARAVR